MPRRLLGDQPRVVFEQLEAAVGAERLGPGLDRAVAAGDRLGADPGAGAVVAGEEAVGVGDRDLAPGLGVGGGELGDLVARAAAALVELAQQLRLARRRHIFGARPRSAAARSTGRARQRPSARVRLAAQRRGGFVGGPLEVGRVEPVDVGEVGGGAVDDADPGALLGARLDRLDPRLVDRHRGPPRRSAKTSAKRPPLARARARTRSATAGSSSSVTTFLPAFAASRPARSGVRRRRTARRRRRVGRRGRRRGRRRSRGGRRAGGAMRRRRM